MTSILEKVYANALVLSAGLLLGTATDNPGQVAKPAQESRSSEGGPATNVQRHGGTRAAGRAGAESPELALLRRAEARMFHELDDLSNDSLDGPFTRDAPLTCSVRGPEVARNQSSVDGVTGASTDIWGGLRMPDIPVRQDPRVERYIRYFSEEQEGRRTFETWLRRSGRYREIIFQTLRDNGLPEDLIAVVFIESGCGPTAVSSAGATGLWQLMPKTARAYGLTVDRSYDERRGIWRSTAAAARHLADLYDYFRSWDQALAGYNFGHQRLSDVAEQMATDDFWVLSRIAGALPRETTFYVPKVLAVAVLLNNLDRFGFDGVKPEPGIDATPMEVAPGVRLSMLARAAGTSLARIRAWNPEFRRDVVPNMSAPVLVHVPSEGLARARVMLPRLMDEAERDTRDLQVPAAFDWGRDDLTGGAQRLEATATAGRRPVARALPQHLDSSDQYFDRDQQAHAAARPLSSQPSSGSDGASSDTGANVSLSAPTQGTDVTVERKTSGGTRPDGRVAQGQAEPRPRPSPPSARQPKQATAEKPRASTAAASQTRIVLFMASGDDSPESIARALGVRATDVRAANDLGPTDRIANGRVLRIPITKQALRATERQRRDAHHKAKGRMHR
ncbi:MAG: transglycosylase SLT domain-containing protein [Polyangiaceae bacterium]|jgi:soluble lytic murein transglycosylase-like protein|nr:transglycosylase SLT domain-containing protein [Polyangiaceae bacterium]